MIAVCGMALRQAVAEAAPTFVWEDHKQAKTDRSSTSVRTTRTYLSQCGKWEQLYTVPVRTCFRFPQQGRVRSKCGPILHIAESTPTTPPQSRSRTALE